MDPLHNRETFASSYEEEQVSDITDQGVDMNAEIVNEMDGEGIVSGMEHQEDMVVDGGPSLQQHIFYIHSQGQISSEISAFQPVLDNTGNATIGMIPVIISTGSWTPPSGVPVTMAATLPSGILDEIVAEDIKREMEELQSENERIKNEIKALKIILNE